MRTILCLLVVLCAGCEPTPDDLDVAALDGQVVCTTSGYACTLTKVQGSSKWLDPARARSADKLCARMVDPEMPAQ